MDINPKRILVIQHKQIGDVILTTPIVKVLKERYPDAYIAFLTEKFCAPILEGNPYIDEIISFDRKELKGIFAQLKFYLLIRRKKFDLLIDFFQNPRSALITMLSGAKVKLSYDHPTRGRFYDITVKPRPGYAVDYKLNMLEGIGIFSKDNYPVVTVPEEAERFVDEYYRSVGITDDDFIVIIDPTHKRGIRQWTKEGFARLIDIMSEKYGAKSILVWGPGEHDTVKDIAAMCKYRCYVSPKTDLKQLAALLKKAHLMVGNDSAPRHLAVSQGLPTLVIAGPTSDGWLHPDPIHRVKRKGLDCQPCNLKECDYYIKCMKSLTAEEVDEALQEFIGVSATVERFLTREDIVKPARNDEAQNG